MKKKMKTELCGVCLALLLTACGGPAEENRALPVVSVAQAEAVTGSGSRNYTFISEPCRTTELAFRVVHSIYTIVFLVNNSLFDS